MESLVDSHAQRLKSIIRMNATPGAGAFSADPGMSPDEANEISSTLDRISNKLKMRMSQGVDIETTAASPPGQSRQVHIDNHLLMQAQRVINVSTASTHAGGGEARRDLTMELDGIDVPEEDVLLRHLEEKLADVTHNTVGQDELLTESHAVRLIEKTKRLVVERRQEIVRTQDRLDGALKELNTVRQQENLLLQSRIAALKKEFKERVVEFEKDFLNKAERARQEMLDKIMDQKAQCELAIEEKADALIAAVQSHAATQSSTTTTSTTVEVAASQREGYGAFDAANSSSGYMFGEGGYEEYEEAEVGPGGGYDEMSGAGREHGGHRFGGGREQVDRESVEALERRLRGGGGGAGAGAGALVPSHRGVRRGARTSTGSGAGVGSPHVRYHASREEKREAHYSSSSKRAAGEAGGRPASRPHAAARGKGTISPERAHRLLRPLERRGRTSRWSPGSSHGDSPQSGRAVTRRGREGGGGAQGREGGSVRWSEPAPEARAPARGEWKPGKGIVRVLDLMSDSDSEI